MEKMKKFCLLICMLVLLSACPAFAANPFDVHEGGFGPTIKGIQLGMPMTLIELVGLGLQFEGLSEFRIRIDNVGQNFQGEKGYVILKFTKDGKELTGWEIVEQTVHLYLQDGTLGKVFEFVNKDGFAQASLYFEANFFNINNKNRVIGFNLEKSVFGAEAMSGREFARALDDAYHLPDLKLNGAEYIGPNPTEGWQVVIGVYNIQVNPINIPEPPSPPSPPVTLPGGFN